MHETAYIWTAENDMNEYIIDSLSFAVVKLKPAKKKRKKVAQNGTQSGPVVSSYLWPGKRKPPLTLYRLTEQTVKYPFSTV